MISIQRLPALIVTILAPLLLPAQDNPKVKALLDKVVSPDATVRFSARAEAPQVGTAAILPLAKLYVEPPADVKDPKQRLEVSITARAAIEKIVHYAARSGADAERKAAAAELGKMLYPEQPVKLKREMLHLMAHVCDHEFVSSVSRLLGDPDKTVREAARLALERIPGPAAVAALVEGIKESPEERKADLIFSLGKKGDASVVPMLVGITEKAKGRTRVAALEALARIGAPEAEAAFAAVLGASELPERAPIFTEYLRLADNLPSSRNAAVAEKIYKKSLASAPLDHQRERALLALTRESGAQGTEAIIASLSDAGDRVRRLALTRLRDLTGPDVLTALKKAYDDSKVESKAALLRAVAEKDKATAAPLIAEAAQSPNDELKITALDLDGKLVNLDLEPMYLKVAQSGSPLVKPVAMKAYLLVARKRFDTNDKPGALGMYLRSLETAGSDEDRAEGLKGIIAVGDPKAIDAVAGLLKDPILGSDAARGYVGMAALIGKAGEKDKAEEHLKRIVTGDFPRDVRAQAAEELRKLGRDPQQAILAQGFVVNWWLVGPMENTDNKGLETKYFPEDVIDLEHEQRIEARRFRWQEYKDLTLDGVIDLVPVFRRSDNRVAYAYTELAVPADREVLFKLGSDDGIACWLNGERLHLNNAQRSLKVDDDSVKARLKQGKNKVLLKISNTGSTWAFVLRLTDLEGKALDASAMRAK